MIGFNTVVLCSVTQPKSTAFCIQGLGSGIIGYVSSHGHCATSIHMDDLSHALRLGFHNIRIGLQCNANTHATYQNLYVQ